MEGEKVETVSMVNSNFSVNESRKIRLKLQILCVQVRTFPQLGDISAYLFADENDLIE
jgi:hypothetical protein